MLTYLTYGLLSALCTEVLPLESLMQTFQGSDGLNVLIYRVVPVGTVGLGVDASLGQKS